MTTVFESKTVFAAIAVLRQQLPIVPSDIAETVQYIYEDMCSESPVTVQELIEECLDYFSTCNLSAYDETRLNAEFAVEFAEEPTYNALLDETPAEALEVYFAPVSEVAMQSVSYINLDGETITCTKAERLDCPLADCPDVYDFQEPVPAKPAKKVYRIAGKFCTKQAFVTYVHGRLAILESLVAKLNRDLLKDISNKTFDAVLACLRKLYKAIDSLSAELARLDTV